MLVCVCGCVCVYILLSVVLHYSDLQVLLYLRVVALIYLHLAVKYMHLFEPSQ